MRDSSVATGCTSIVPQEPGGRAMKRIVLETVIAAGLAFLLVRAPLDLMAFAPQSSVPYFLGESETARAAALSLWAAGAAALLTLVVGTMVRGVRSADARHREAVARLDARVAPTWAETPRAQRAAHVTPAAAAVWRPRANPYLASVRSQFAPARPARARKIADARPRRAPRPVRRNS